MFFVYIRTNRKHGTLYTGVSGGLLNRLNLHRDGAGSEFVRKHR
jgi:putative endonuclease